MSGWSLSDRFALCRQPQPVPKMAVGQDSRDCPSSQPREFFFDFGEE